MEAFAQQEKASDVDISITPMKGRLLVTFIKKPSDTTSALIEPSGKIINFNNDMHDVQAGNADRYTAVNVSKKNDEIKKYAEKNQNPLLETNPHVINFLSVYFPEYISPLYTIGSAVANIRSDDGNIWATFVFRGLTTYMDKEAVIFDIKRQFPGTSEPAILGIAIVDANTAMPLFVAFNAGTRARLTQKTCKKS